MSQRNSIDDTRKDIKLTTAKDLVPLEKQSKKAQRKANTAKRSVWTLKPTTRVVPDKTIYSRNRFKASKNEE